MLNKSKSKLRHSGDFNSSLPALNPALNGVNSNMEYSHSNNLTDMNDTDNSDIEIESDNDPYKAPLDDNTPIHNTPSISRRSSDIGQHVLTMSESGKDIHELDKVIDILQQNFNGVHMEEER